MALSKPQKIALGRIHGYIRHQKANATLTLLDWQCIYKSLLHDLEKQALKLADQVNADQYHQPTNH